MSKITLSKFVLHNYNKKKISCEYLRQFFSLTWFANVVSIKIIHSVSISASVGLVVKNVASYVEDRRFESRV